MSRPIGLVKPGATLSDRFLLVEEIGRGGMSTVYRAEDLKNGRQPVVVKIPLPMFASGVGAWSIFQQEAEIGGQLDHPAVLKFIPLAAGERRGFIVTEHVPGETLADRLLRGPPLRESEALRIAAQVCAAVEHVHGRGFVHYDLKPGNVMLCPDGTVRLIDFGMAHVALTDRFRLGGPSPAIGSSAYVAPEQIRRKRGRKSVDVYSLGAILYEMLTGRHPFPGDDPFVIASARTLGDPTAPRAIDPGISRQAEEITLRALRRDPAARYPSAAALRKDLEQVDQVTVSGLSESLEPVTRTRRALRLARYVTLVGVLPIAVQVALFFLLWRHLAVRR